MVVKPLVNMKTAHAHIRSPQDPVSETTHSDADLCYRTPMATESQAAWWPHQNPEATRKGHRGDWGCASSILSGLSCRQTSASRVFSMLHTVKVSPSGFAFMLSSVHQPHRGKGWAREYAALLRTHPRDSDYVAAHKVGGLLARATRRPHV